MFDTDPLPAKGKGARVTHLQDCLLVDLCSRMGAGAEGKIFIKNSTVPFKARNTIDLYNAETPLYAR